MSDERAKRVETDITPEELRKLRDSRGWRTVGSVDDALDRAADTIERLQNQVERLRKAAKMLLDSYDDPDAENKAFPDALYSGVSYRSLLTLRAALQAGEDQ